MLTSEQSVKERPAFLTVICIISFIFLGIQIFGNIIYAIFSRFLNVFDPYFLQYRLEIESETYNTPFNKLIPDFLSFIERVIESAFTTAVLNLLLSIIALFGVILMWNLKKTGFFLYSTAKVLILTLPFIFLGINFITIFSIVVSGIFVLTFIVLYAVNLKFMN